MTIIEAEHREHAGFHHNEVTTVVEISKQSLGSLAGLRRGSRDQSLRERRTTVGQGGSHGNVDAQPLKNFEDRDAALGRIRVGEDIRQQRNLSDSRRRIGPPESAGGMHHRLASKSRQSSMT